MVEFRFNVYGYDFQQKIRAFQSSFMRSAAALTNDVNALEQNLVEYEAAVERDPSAWEGERDEDGSLLWDRSKILEMDIRAAHEGLDGLRKSYVIAVYHHWERSARAWTGAKQKCSYVDLCKRTAARGYPIAGQLEAVSRLVNTLKHDSDDKGVKLMASWPEVLPSGFKPAPGRTGWYEAIRLTDEQVIEAFDVIARSGPTVDS